MQLFTLARLFQIGDIRLEAKSCIRKSLVLRCGKSKRFEKFLLFLVVPTLASQMLEVVLLKLCHVVLLILCAAVTALAV